jgi:hypothetical protein
MVCLALSKPQLSAVAACAMAIRELPAADRIDVVVVLAKSLCELRLNVLLFPEDAGDSTRESNQKEGT